MSQPQFAHSKCQRAFDEVETAKAADVENRRQVDITDSHVLYRGVVHHHLDPGHTSGISAGTFDQWGMSVFAEGPDLPELDKQAICDKHKFAGLVRIETKTVRLLNLTVVHDPYPDPNGSQHPNHVRVICKKTPEILETIHEKHTWAFPPKQ